MSHIGRVLQYKRLESTCRFSPVSGYTLSVMTLKNTLMSKYGVLGIFFVIFVAVFVVLGVYLRRRSEERMWKKALKETHAKRQR